MPAHDPRIALTPEPRPEPPAAGNWFYARRGASYGPVSVVDLRAAAQLGFLGPDDLVRRAEGTDWVPARTIRGLFDEAGEVMKLDSPSS